MISICRPLYSLLCLLPSCRIGIFPWGFLNGKWHRLWHVFKPLPVAFLFRCLLFVFVCCWLGWMVFLKVNYKRSSIANKPTACQRKIIIIAPHKRLLLQQMPRSPLAWANGYTILVVVNFSVCCCICWFFFPCFCFIFQGVQDPGLSLERNSVMAETTAFVFLGVKASAVLAPLQQNQV